MCESFGLQYSLSESSNIIPRKDFIFLGYDIVDLWTQSSYLFQFKKKKVDSNANNEVKLIESSILAVNICKIADKSYPDYSPFQPIGVWMSLEKGSDGV
jgi:hypothetical protein